MVEYLKRPIACDTAALVRGVRRYVGSLPPADSGAMLAAVLSAVKSDAELRDLAKVLRAEAKRHNSATAAAAFAGGGGAASVALQWFSESC